MVIPLAAAVFGLLAGLLVDRRIRRVAAAEVVAAEAAAVKKTVTETTGRGTATAAGRRPGPPLDRHLVGGRRLLVPLLSATSCLAVALRRDGDPALVPFLFFLPLLAGLAVVDLHTHRLPNALTGPALAGGLLLVAAGPRSAAVSAVVSAVILFGALLTLNLLRPTGMGMGDVKLAGLIGLFAGLLGLGPALLAVVLASVLALVAGTVLIAGGRITRRTPVPFGPWLALGTLITLLAGPELVQVYLRVVT